MLIDILHHSLFFLGSGTGKEMNDARLTLTTQYSKAYWEQKLPFQSSSLL